MIKITVITCTYNASQVLQRTLDSVMSQSYRHVEHIIMDGVSKDDTVTMALDYKRRSDDMDCGHTVRVLSEPDKGLYDAMNKALMMTTGDYLVFLNAGDVLADANTLSNVAATASDQEPLPGVLYGDTDIVDNEGNFLHHRRLAPPDRLSWRSFREGMLVCHQSFYALTSIARALPYNINKYRLSADVDWCIRVMKQSEKESRRLCRVPHVLTNYLDGGMSVQNHRASLVERFRVMHEHYGLLPTIGMHLWFCVRAIKQ